MKSQLIREGKRVIGTWTPETNTFQKMVNSAKHRARFCDGYGITAKYFNEILLEKNARIVIIEDRVNEYITTAEEMKRNGIYKSLGGNELQIFLPLSHFVKTDNQVKLL